MHSAGIGKARFEPRFRGCWSSQKLPNALAEACMRLDDCTTQVRVSLKSLQLPKVGQPQFAARPKL